MSSIGFAPRAASELEQLRSAYKSINDVTRNIANAVKCIKEQDLRLAEHHLRAAEWHASQARQAIASIGQSRRENRKK
jgi:ABC-type Fe3+-citrate transport system substrate-binding protein